MGKQIKIETVVNIPNDLSIINNEEFARLKEQILDLQNQIRQMGLPNNQSVITNEDTRNLKLMDVTEVAKRLKCNRNKVYDLINSGALQGLKLGRIKISTIELHDFLVRNTGKDLTDPYNIKPLVEREDK